MRQNKAKPTRKSEETWFHCPKSRMLVNEQICRNCGEFGGCNRQSHRVKRSVVVKNEKYFGW